jgi:hypothetical protein
MFYINNDRKVSLGIGDMLYTTKMSAGQRKLFDAWVKILHEKLESVAADFTGEITAHKEGFSKNHFGWLALTDIADIGGHKTGEDGGFLIYAKTNKIINLSFLSGNVAD